MADPQEQPFFAAAFLNVKKILSSYSQVFSENCGLKDTLVLILRYLSDTIVEVIDEVDGYFTKNLIVL